MFSPLRVRGPGGNAPSSDTGGPWGILGDHAPGPLGSAAEGASAPGSSNTGTFSEDVAGNAFLLRVTMGD